MKRVFMHDNAPSHAPKVTHKFFKRKSFTRKKIMEWLSLSPDLNPIENLWSIVKMKLYKGGKRI